MEEPRYLALACAQLSLAFRAPQRFHGLWSVFRETDSVRNPLLPCAPEVCPYSDWQQFRPCCAPGFHSEHRTFSDGFV